MSKAKGVEIIRYNLIFNFVLFVLIIILSILAFKAGNDYNSILSSYNRKNLWCYNDVNCDFDTGNDNKINTFNQNDNHSNVSDQNVTFQYSKGSSIGSHNFNIYTSADPPVGTQLIENGICAGYYNHSSTGTSVYLKYFYNSTSWTGANVGNLMTLAFKGTSASTLGYSKLKNNGGNYSYTGENLNGLSIFSDVSDSANLFNNNIDFGENTFTIEQGNGEPIGLLNNYTNTLNIINHSEKDDNVSWRRCIDPSFIPNIPCPGFKNTDGKTTNYSIDNKLYYYPNENNSSGPSQVCSNDDFKPGGDFVNGNCGYPFCFNNNNNNNTNNFTNYKSQDFSIGNQFNGGVQGNNYLYKGKQIVGSGSTLNLYNNAQQIPGTVQAQALLFCGGTSTSGSNIDDSDISGEIGGTNKGSQFPTSPTTAVNARTPYNATQPNIRVQGEGNKVILGFK